MYLIYIDESGKPTRKDKEDFVLVGLCINEQHYRNIDQKIDELKNKYFPKIDLDNVEFHAKDIAYNKKVYTSLTFDQRFHLFEDIYSLISKIECTIIGTIIRKNKIRKKDLDIELWAFRLLFDRFCKLLERRNKDEKKPNEYALLLFDSIRPVYDLKLRHKIIDMFRRGTYYNQNDYIIEDPLFISSSYRNMVQLVDCIAFCIRRKYRETSTKKSYLDIYFDRYFEIIKDKIDKDKHGKIDGYGIKIFPKN